jgi:hypothetical protein
LHVCKLLHWNLRGEDLARALQAAVWCIGPWGDSRHNFRDVWTLSEHLLSQLSCLGIEFQTTIERQAVAGSPCFSKRIPNCKQFTSPVEGLILVGSLFSRYFWLDIWTNFLRVFLANNRETNKRAIVLQADAREREREWYIYIHIHAARKVTRWKYTMNLSRKAMEITSGNIWNQNSLMIARMWPCGSSLLGCGIAQGAYELPQIEIDHWLCHTHTFLAVLSRSAFSHPKIMETYEAAEKHLDNGDLQLSVRPGHFLHRHEIFSQKPDTKHPKTYETSMIYYSLSSFIIVYHHLSLIYHQLSLLKTVLSSCLSSFFVIFSPFKNLQVPVPGLRRMRCPSRKGLAKRQWRCTCSCGDPGTAWGAPGSRRVPEMAGKMGKLVRKRGFIWFIYMVLHGLIGIILRWYWDYNGKNKQYWGFTGLVEGKLLTEKSMVFQMNIMFFSNSMNNAGPANFETNPLAGQPGWSHDIPKSVVGDDVPSRSWIWTQSWLRSDELSLSVELISQCT